MRMLNTIARRVSTSVPRPLFIYITEYGLIITDKFKMKEQFGPQCSGKLFQTIPFWVGPAAINT